MSRLLAVILIRRYYCEATPANKSNNPSTMFVAEKHDIRRETEAILAILLWLSCWCSFSAASKPKLSAVVFIIGCRREATPKHKTGPAAVAFSIECRRGATPKHKTDPAAVAFSIECRRGATPKHKTDPAEGAGNVWNFCQFYRIFGNIPSSTNENKVRFWVT